MYNQSNKKVLILTKSAKAIGGVEEVVDLHCKTFLKNKFSVNLLSVKSKNHLFTKNYKNIEKTFVNEEEGFFSFNLGIRFYKKFIFHASNSSILICHQPFNTGFLSLILLSFLNKLKLFSNDTLKVYIYIHSLPSRSLLHRFIFYILLRILLFINSDYIPLVSSFSEDNKYLLNKLKNKTSKLIIPQKINNKVNINEIDLKDKYIVDQFIKIKNNFRNRNFGVFIGRIAFYKGLLNLINAYKNAKDLPILLIFGIGPYSKVIANKLKLIKSKSNIYFFNSFIQESTKYFILQNSDFFYFPSITKGEAYGIAQLEALSSGIPVLNTNLGTGVNEVSKNNLHGVTVSKPMSVNSLRKSIYKINDLTNKGFFKKDELEKYVRENYSYEVFEKQFFKIFLN